MPDNSNYNPVMESPRFGGALAESPFLDEDVKTTLPNPDKLPNLMFLSANFSSDSLQNDTARDDNAYEGTTPLQAAFQPETPAGNFPYANKRLSIYESANSLLSSPAAPVGQPSFSYHQRAGSSSAGTRPRPRSVLFNDPAANFMIHEHASPSNDPPKRNSILFAKNQYTPASLPPPTEPRLARLRSNSPSRRSSPGRQKSVSPYRRSTSPVKALPFNFKPQDLNQPNTLAVKPAYRKGHRYKHSSVSMNLFQEPIPIADANLQPDLIPDLYPIPNFKESVGSANPTQKFKLALSVAHFVTAIIVFLAGVHTHQAAFSTLAHLVFYDSLGSFMVACVDIMSNFEVWGKSSIAYPFGLSRLETLTGFGLSTSLIMVGCDLVSHFVEELVVNLVDPSLEGSSEHGSHHIHGSEHSRVDWFLYELILVVVILVTWFTSMLIFDVAPISDLMSVEKPPSPKKGLLGRSQPIVENNPRLSILRIFARNPIRVLTLTYSVFLSVVPLLSDRVKEKFGLDVNEVSTLVVASTLCYAGWSLVKTLGGILLISFPYSDYDYNMSKACIHDRISQLQCFKTTYLIKKLFVTKVSPQLYVSGVEVIMKGGSPDDESRLIFEINRIIVNTLKDFESGCVVETTISTERV